VVVLKEKPSSAVILVVILTVSLAEIEAFLSTNEVLKLLIAFIFASNSLERSRCDANEDKDIESAAGAVQRKSQIGIQGVQASALLVFDK
jgi:hypothetical protein